MTLKLSKTVAAACGLAMALALSACGDRGSEGGAQRAARNETGGQAHGDAAAAAALQRSGSGNAAQRQGG
jgi:hypothetical protein